MARNDNSMTRNHGRPRQHNLKQKETTTMKTKLTKMTMGSLSFACALVCLLAAMTLSTHSAAQGTPTGRIQGTWDHQLTMFNCQTGAVTSGPNPALGTYHAGGTFAESTSGFPAALKSPGLGIWRHLGGNTYEVRFKFFVFNTQNNFTGWRDVSLQVTLDQTGDSYEASGTGKAYLPNGNLSATTCISVSATRMDFE
jgi:hypothetical protein